MALAVELSQSRLPGDDGHAAAAVAQGQGGRLITYRIAVEIVSTMRFLVLRLRPGVHEPKQRGGERKPFQRFVLRRLDLVLMRVLVADELDRAREQHHASRLLLLMRRDAQHRLLFARLLFHCYRSEHRYCSLPLQAGSC